MTTFVTPRARRFPRPSIPFFWWRRAAVATSAARPAPSSVEDPGVFISDADYVPTGSADLWKKSRPGRLR